MLKFLPNLQNASVKMLLNSRQDTKKVKYSTGSNKKLYRVEVLFRVEETCFDTVYYKV